jgi:hypothetical protein
MPDDSTMLNALLATFRRRLAANAAYSTTLEGYADKALAEMSAGTTIVSLNLEGGGGSSVVNCNPAILLQACEELLAEKDATDVGTGTTHLDLSLSRIET